MMNFYTLMKIGTRTFLFLILFSFAYQANSQQNIDWQRSIGTDFSDTAIKLFTDEEGNLVVIGSELHEDFTGNLRNYMVISKIDLNGQEIWKTYHDVAFETFNPPFDYYIGKQFYNEQFGEKLISLVIHIAGRRMIYSLSDNTGEFYTYSDINADVISVDRNNVQAYAEVRCSLELSCYGPDSLIVQKFDPAPIIGQNPLRWSFELKQNLRTAQIDGHYDFNNQDIAMDDEGNVYLLTQIERWDFQHCTDCGDAFIDAWSEIFKFDTAGVLLAHIKLKTAKAVVSNMQFVHFSDGKMAIKIDDINASGTALLTSIYILNEDLGIIRQFNLDRQYNHVAVDDNLDLYACTSIYDLTDPNIKGLSDVLVASYNSEGVFQWKSYFGGSNFEFPVGLVRTKDDGIAFFAKTDSDDFDVEENLGGQDMWLVKLTENTTSNEHINDSESLSVFPNPCSDYINVSTSGISSIHVIDIYGREVLDCNVTSSAIRIDLSVLPLGIYIIRGVNEKMQAFSSKIFKLE